MASVHASDHKLHVGDREILRVGDPLRGCSGLIGVEHRLFDGIESDIDPFEPHSEPFGHRRRRRVVTPQSQARFADLLSRVRSWSGPLRRSRHRATLWRGASDTADLRALERLYSTSSTRRRAGTARSVGRRASRVRSLTSAARGEGPLGSALADRQRDFRTPDP